MKNNKTTLIVSDIHIGRSKDTRVVQFIEFLKTATYDTIIFNGDIIDLVMGDAIIEHWKYVKEIMKLIKGKRVYYLVGNHDVYCLLLIPFGWLFGMTIRKRIHYNGYIIEHGDWVEYYIQLRHFFNKDVIYYNDKSVPSEENFHNNTIELSKIKGKPFIVGHSHSPLIIENVIYDEGDWVNHEDSIHDSYIIMTEKTIEYKTYSEKK